VLASVIVCERTKAGACAGLIEGQATRRTEVPAELAVRRYSNKHVARPGGVMRPGMQLSFLFDCDDVALTALKLDPGMELARVVPADVGSASVRFLTMLSAVARTASRVARCSEWIAISVPRPALSRREWSRECGHHPACSALHQSKARAASQADGIIPLK
jgi:hypothetical protein